MEDQLEEKQSLRLIDIVLTFVLISIVVIGILTLLGPAICTYPESIILNL